MTHSRLGLVAGALIAAIGGVIAGFGYQGGRLLADALGQPAALDDLVPGLGIFAAGVFVVALSRSAGSSTADTVDAVADVQPDARYQELGRWARHYSTIRMAVATLLFTVAGGIVIKSLEASPHSQGRHFLLALAISFEALALLVFVRFTYLTYRLMNSQRRMLGTRPNPDPSGEPKRIPLGPKIWYGDMSMWVLVFVFVASIGLGLCLRGAEQLGKA